MEIPQMNEETFQKYTAVCKRTGCFAHARKNDPSDTMIEAVRTAWTVSVTAWNSIQDRESFEVYHADGQSGIPLDTAWDFAEALSERISAEFGVRQSIVNYTMEKQAYAVRLSFLWDDGAPDSRIFHITAPSIGRQSLEQVLKKEHQALDAEKNGIYDCDGRTPENLIRAVCDKYGWDCEELEYDADLELD